MIMVKDTIMIHNLHSSMVRFKAIKNAVLSQDQHDLHSNINLFSKLF